MYPVGLVFAGESITGSYGVGGSAAAGVTVPNVGALTRVRWTRMAKPSDLTRWQALESVNDEINFIVGPSAVSLMAIRFTAPLSLITAAALAAIGTFGVTALPGEPHRPRGRQARAARWMSVEHATVLGAVAGLGMVLGGLAVTVVAYTAELGYPAWSAAIFPLNAGASLVAALVVGRMHTGDLGAAHRRATWLLPAVLIPFGLGDGIALFTVTAMIAGLGTSPILIQSNSLLAATTSIERRTEAFSWIAAAAGMGIAAGMMITGLLVDAVGADPARLCVTAFGACPAAITLAMTLRRPRSA